VCDVGVLRQCVMVRYGGMLRCVTVCYGGALRLCVTLSMYNGGALRCVTVHYGYVTVSYASPCSKLGLRFHMRIGKTLDVVFLKVSI